ncbi:hypothetical protein CRG98_050080, partial [Punica granatum]
MLRKFSEPTRSSFLPPCRVCSPVRAYFHASQVSRPCWLVPLPTLPGLFTRVTLLSRFASPPSLLARPSRNLTFMLRKYDEPACSCFLPPCRVCSPVRFYFDASQFRRACWLVLLATLPGLLTLSRACWLDPLATLPGLLTRASFLSCFAISPSLLARAFATLPGLLTCASFLSCFASSPSQLARSTCNPVGSPHPCELTFMLRNFAEPTRLCFLLPCRVCTPVRVYFHALQVPRTCSVVQLATLPGLLTCASLLSCFASSSSLLGRATCNLS